MSGDVAISVKGVSKDFVLPHQKANSIKSVLVSPFRRFDVEKQHALKDVSFDIKKGEFFGIVGRNGSGKSTLLKCLAGVYYPDKGSIEVNGTLVPFIELGVGFNPELSGRDNVFLNGALLGFSRKEVAEMYDEIVEFAELEKFMDQKLKNYSSGMQVRLAFSIAIQAKGDILLLDEVLAVGDSAFQRKCFNYFEELKKNSTTVILVTHDMSAVQRFCSRALVLDSGEIRKQGSALEIADEYRIINLESTSKKHGSIEKDQTVQVEIKAQTKDAIVFTMAHNRHDKESYYFGFSILKDGNTVAELNSLDYNTEHVLEVGESLSYKLDTSRFNHGVYEIAATLFKAQTKDAVAYTKIRPQFVIKGNDPTRGGALYLDHNWGF